MDRDFYAVPEGDIGRAFEIMKVNLNTLLKVAHSSSLPCVGHGFLTVGESGYIQFRHFVDLKSYEWNSLETAERKHTTLLARPFVGVITTPIGLVLVGRPARYASEFRLYSERTRQGIEKAADLP